MTTAANVPSWLGVAASLSLILLAGVVAWRTRLGITRELMIVTVRAFAQLAAVGLLLGVVFDYGGLPAAFGWLAVMAVIAGQVAGRRAAGLPGSRRNATIAIGVGVVVTMGVLLALRIIDSTPTVLIPVGGMVVSGAMVATGVTLRRVRDDARSSRPEIEARLALGLSARDAFAPTRRDAVRTALIPSMDQTKVVGLIALPGAMTGLILAGVAPLAAIRYQIVVMYMLLSAAIVAATLAARLTERDLFDQAHRLHPLD
ncbi:MAG: iron export ABC transporter permease subunit FetB [Actinobacteria bacterium]|nr:iron export ABC transporter permease subunit FetB [Actinomycetota bacterium]